MNKYSIIKTPMKESLTSTQHEVIPYDDAPERAIGRSALYAVNNVESRITQEEEKTMERGNGLVYAQDQEKYKPYAAEATSIITAAISGDLEALNRISNEEFRAALKTRIESHKGNVPAEEVEKMISVACTALAVAEHGADFDKAA